jgi:hypothetical protein
MVSLVARLLAAQTGRVVASRMGGGTVQTPGIFVGKAREVLERLSVDPAARLVADAVQDATLFRALMTRTRRPEQAARVRRRLDAWLAGVLQESGEGIGPGADDDMPTARTVP